MSRGRVPMTKAERDKLIRTYPVLKDLSPDLMKQVERDATLIHAPAGKQLFNDGSACTHFPLLLQGVIRASKCAPDGHEILLYRLNPGESCVITVVALLGETAYPAVGTADADLVVFGLPRSLFLELVLKSAPFRVFVFGYLSDRLAHL